ncbi:unnamed protein product [Lactuca virosa]|uniref:Cytochrome P450 n=1 Tax=Lactuca virosa TaxID=75947 RepID=A0AAU9P2U2_9ASTR|nr:unnamed protein product [Lactuca virosa]
MLLLLVTLLASIVLFLYRRRSHRVINWVVFGMTPDLILNAYRVHDFFTDLIKLRHGTFLLKGPWFANMDMLLTSDPANVHHILSKNFPNYPKGPEFRKIFNILGDGIFNSDDELWEIHRKTTMSLLKHPDFNLHLEANIRNKIEKGLLPLLEFVSHDQQETDLQEIFQRFTFDAICLLLLDYDPETLSLHLPYNACEKAFTDAEEALLWRHLLPEKVWKLQHRFTIGKEKKLIEASKAFDEFIYKCLSRKENELTDVERVEKEVGLLKFLITSFQGQTGTSGNSRTVENKIREEIEKQVGDSKWKYLNAKELEGLVYPGGLCEALRLYPPVALEHKAPSDADVLPSGHVVNKHSRIILSFYSMGRMEWIWGKDCLEFKPERWFSARGGVKHEPSYKFTAFHAGPRTCLGKEMGLIQMKMVATAIIYHYHVELVKDQEVCPADSIILQMKYGLKVRLFPLREIKT